MRRKFWSTKFRNTLFTISFSPEHWCIIDYLLIIYDRFSYSRLLSSFLFILSRDTSKNHLLWRLSWLTLKHPVKVKLLISYPDRKLTSWNRQRWHDVKQWVGTFSCTDKDQCNKELFLSGCPSTCPCPAFDGFSRFRL